MPASLQFSLRRLRKIKVVFLDEGFRSIKVKNFKGGVDWVSPLSTMLTFQERGDEDLRFLILLERLYNFQMPSIFRFFSLLTTLPNSHMVASNQGPVTFYLLIPIEFQQLIYTAACFHSCLFAGKSEIQVTMGC